MTNRVVRGQWRRRVALIAALAALAAVVEVDPTDPAPNVIGEGDPWFASLRVVDTDGDGIADYYEEEGWATARGGQFRTDPSVADTDGDGLLDSDEAGRLVAVVGTRIIFEGLSSPHLPDTDLDGLLDADEVDLNLDPFNRDSDGDALADYAEVAVIGTAPDRFDTDRDGLDDALEWTQRARKGLDPVEPDERTSATQYSVDFVSGAILGEGDPRDSLAWLAGNLAASGSSVVPLVGWVVGTAVDARDAAFTAARGDWVGFGFSAIGLVPYAGDGVAIPAKASRFVVRNPDLAGEVAALVAGIDKLSASIKVQTSKLIWGSDRDELIKDGLDDNRITRLERKRVRIDLIAEARRRPGHIEGEKAGPFSNGGDGEKHLSATLRVSDTESQVRLYAQGCVKVCNATNLRIIDVLKNGVAHESKVGKVSLTAGARRQIESDRHLIESGQIEGAHWHFYTSGVTGKLGPSRPLLDLLDNYGISYTVHLPAS